MSRSRKSPGASCTALLLLCLLGVPDRAATEELTSGPAVLTVSREGSGFVDEICLSGRTVIEARDGFAGATVLLTEAGSGAPGSLLSRSVVATLRANLRELQARDGALEARGAYTNGRVELPFLRRIEIGPAAGSFRVREEVDFTGLDARRLVASHALALPLRVCDDHHLRMFAFGGRRRVEMFRMDMNDEPRRNQLISDSRAFRPYWDLGGLEQLSGSYRIWRANHADTRAYPVEDGPGGRGWADYSEPEWGVTVQVRDPLANAPWSLRIDARRGAFSILPHPPSELPRSGKELGKRVFEFVVVLHEASWPAGHACELSPARYRELLTLLDGEGGFTHLDHALRALGVAAKEGPKSSEALDDVFRRLFLKERVQPSVVLRLLYRGDAWRMQGLVREQLGKDCPRNQPLERWDELARELLEQLASRDS